MIKKYFFIFTIFIFFVFLVAPMAYACDVLGCMMYGNKQDVLILGEVTSELENLRYVKISFVFPQSRDRTLKEGKQIVVTNLQKVVNLTDEEAKTIISGKKYLMSLNKKDNFYVPSWGIYEITGMTYKDARLVKNQYSDYAALQIFINSGGTERNFYFNGDMAFWRPNDGGADIQIYPVVDRGESEKIEDRVLRSVQRRENIIWYVGGTIGFLAISIVLVFAIRKRVRK